MTNSVDPDQTAPKGVKMQSILGRAVCLYLIRQ